MNSLMIDFQQTPKSKKRIFIGIVLILLAVVSLFLALSQSNPKLWQVLNPLILILLGMSNISEGSGRSISSFFGKAFLAIDEESFEFKAVNMKPGIKINWKDIDNIKFLITQVEFIKENSSICRIEYSHFSYRQVQDIKSIISSIADKYDIKIN